MKPIAFKDRPSGKLIIAAWENKPDWARVAGFEVEWAEEGSPVPAEDIWPRQETMPVVQRDYALRVRAP